MPSAGPGDLLPAWERFALSLVSREAAGGGSLPDRGSLLEIEGAELSSVRRRDGTIEVRVWNPTLEPAVVRVGHQKEELGPAQISMLVVQR